MDQPDWTWELQETIPSSTDEGHKLLERLMLALTESGWEGSELFHVQMAAEEAMVNAVTHGNGGDASKSIEVELKVSASTAFLRFRDEGSGFCPDELPNPTDDENLEVVHGRGVFLIRSMMTKVEYNDRGNEVSMWKQREPAAST